jgi:hypothetical protein
MVLKRVIGLVFASAMLFSASAAEVYVRVGPPHSVHERRGPAPSRNHVWISGYHRWDGHAYAWAPGRWEARPRPRAQWVSHHWVHERRGWVLVDGHWR